MVLIQIVSRLPFFFFLSASCEQRFQWPCLFGDISQRMWPNTGRAKSPYFQEFPCIPWDMPSGAAWRWTSYSTKTISEKHRVPSPLQVTLTVSLEDGFAWSTEAKNINNPMSRPFSFPQCQKISRWNSGIVIRLFWGGGGRCTNMLITASLVTVKTESSQHAYQ